jgi:hypothetical protein
MTNNNESRLTGKNKKGTRVGRTREGVEKDRTLVGRHSDLRVRCLAGLDL